MSMKRRWRSKILGAKFLFFGMLVGLWAYKLLAHDKTYELVLFVVCHLGMLFAIVFEESPKRETS